jgi:hypothetical protein
VAELIILGSLYMGLILGLYEFFAMHKDLAFQGSHFLKHFWHTLITTIVLVFAVMNIEFVLELIPQIQSIPILSNYWVLRVVIGLIALAKVHAAGIVVKTKGSGTIGETWAHALIITVLIILTPFIWPLIEPLIEAYVPTSP